MEDQNPETTPAENQDSGKKTDEAKEGEASDSRINIKVKNQVRLSSSPFLFPRFFANFLISEKYLFFRTELKSFSKSGEELSLRN